MSNEDKELAEMNAAYDKKHKGAAVQDAVIAEMNAAYDAAQGKKPKLTNILPPGMKREKKGVAQDIFAQAPRALAKAGLSALDLAEAPSHAAWWAANKLRGVKEERPWLSDMAKDVLKRETGYNLDEPAETLPGHITHDALYYLPGLFTGKVAGEAIKTVGKALPKAIPKTRVGLTKIGRALSKGATSKEALATTAAGAVTSGSLKELGVPPHVAELFAQLGIPSAYALYKYGPKIGGNIVRYGKSLLPEQKALTQAAEKFQGRLDGGVDEALKTLSQYNPALYPQGYNPATIDILQNPALSADYIARVGTTNKGGKAIAAAEAANKAAREAALKNAGLEGGEGRATYDFLADQKAQAAIDEAAKLEALQQKAAQEAEKLVPYEATPEEAGAAIQSGFTKKVEQLEPRRAPAKAQMEEIKASTKHFPGTQDTNAYIDKALESAKGETKAALSSAKKSLAPNKIQYIPDPNDPEKLIEVGASAAELQNWRRSIADKKDAAFRAGKNNTGHELEELLKVFDAEMEQKLPGLKESRAAYHEASKPINELKEHPVIGKHIEPGEYNKGYKVQASKVVAPYVKGISSVENAKAALPALKSQPETMKAVKGYIYSDLADNVIDATTGHVDIKKLERWRKSNPGAFVWMPELEGGLQNAKSAQIELNRAAKLAKQEKQLFEKSIAQKILKADPDKYIHTILSDKNSGHKMTETLKALEADKSGAARESLKEAVAKYFNDVMERKGPQGVVDQITQHKAAFSQIYSPEQVQLMEQIAHAAESRASAIKKGQGIGSITAQKQENLADYIMNNDSLIKKVITHVGISQLPTGAKQVTKAVSAGAKAVTSHINENAEALFTLALIDKEKAIQLLKHTKGMKNAEKTRLANDLITNASRKIMLDNLRTYEKAED